MAAKHYDKTFWRELISGWPSSGLTQADYCRQHSVSVASYHEWRRKLGMRTAREPKHERSSFVRVDLAPTSNPLEVVLQNGRIVRVPSGSNPDAVSALVGALETPAC